MTTEELKLWMDERFESQLRELKEINRRLDCTSENLTSHDRWLWLMRGLGIAIIVALGFIGIKIRI